VGCRYWILPLTYTHPEDGTLPISKSLPSFPPQSQYTHAPLPATHHRAAVPPLIDSGLTVSTTVPPPSTFDQDSVDGIQTNRCHFGPPPPQLRSRKDIKEIVQNALTVIGAVCLFRHPIWNAQDVGRCTSCASSKYLISNSLLFDIFPNIHSLIAFLLLSSNSFQNKANETTSLNQSTIHQQMSIKVA
jgi:hypothetical protein